jgi:GNAT superfamily N-acetyltransferase
MLTIDEYKGNPCRLSSLPYWKMKTFNFPDNLKVIHDIDYDGIKDNYGKDTRYFRLKHGFLNIEEPVLPKGFSYKEVNTDLESELLDIVRIINESYDDIKVNLPQVQSWIELDVFKKELWIFIEDDKLKENIALGIAELDQEVREGMLEWIQVLPDYRCRGFGHAIVTKLLLNMKTYADFVTVSGQVDNNTKPEKLYRRCGFTGNDIWHVIEAIR